MSPCMIRIHMSKFEQNKCICYCFAASTREVILGTDNGQLHEIAVDEKDKKEKYIKFLFELSELSEAFTGLQVPSTFSFCFTLLSHFF